MRQRIRRGLDNVVDLGTQHPPDRFIQKPASEQAGVVAQGLPAMLAKQVHGLHLLKRDQTGANTVVDVMRVVGDFVREVAQLRLQARLFSLKEALSDTARLRQFEPLRIAPRAMLENPLPGLVRQIQPVEGRVTLFQLVDHTQALQVVLEAAVLRHASVQRVLACMAEGRMPQVMRQRNRFHQVLVQPQRTCDRSSQLRDFQRVGHPGAEQVPFMVEEHLRLVDQPAERGGMDDAVAVALELGARRRGLLRMAATAGLRRVTGVGRQLHCLALTRKCNQAAPTPGDAANRSTARSPRAPARQARPGRLHGLAGQGRRS